MTVKCTLSTVSDAIEEHAIRPPAIFVIGSVVGHAPAVSWFEARPLFGTNILVPGSLGTSKKLRRYLSEHGANVILAPAIRIEEPEDWSTVDREIANLDAYDWLVFSSANGVDFTLQRLFALGLDARELGAVKLAAIGPGTADRLRDYHLNADLVPDIYTAEALAEALAPHAAGLRFLLARASRGRDVLASLLRQAKGIVTQVVVYASVGVDDPDPHVAESLAKGKVDWITVASSETARSLHRLYGSSIGSARLASISPLTSGALRELGFEPTVEATNHTMHGIAEAILCHRAIGV